jgi:GNAT superfamily N-acetyltransferase
MITIREIDLNKSSDKKAFVNFDYVIYKDMPHWVAPLRMDVNQRLNPKKHPFYKTAAIKAFLAYRGEKIVGRIAAIDNFQYNEFHGSKIGFFGFFESIDDQKVVDALLQKVEEYHIHAGNKFLHGPVNPSTNYESGLLIEGFDDPPKIMMIYNPPYYVDLLEGYKMSLEMKMFAYHLKKNGVTANDKLLRVKDYALTRAKCSLRLIDPGNMKVEIENIKKIYNKAWENNWGFVPMTDPELDLMANELKLILDPSLAPMIVNEHGEVIAFALALRDINQITKSFNGNLFPFNFLKLLFGKSKINWARVLLLGILPEYRGKGLDAALYYEIIKNGFKLNIDNAEASWILESNEAMNKGIQVVNGEKYKTYGIYQKQISSE